MSAPPDPRQLLTPEQAAKALSISTRQLKRLRASGAIPHVRIGPKCIRFTPEQVAQYIRAHTYGGPIVSDVDLASFK